MEVLYQLSYPGRLALRSQDCGPDLRGPCSTMGAGWLFGPYAFQLALYPALLEALATFAGILEHDRRRGAVTRGIRDGRRCGDTFGGGSGFAHKSTIDAVGHSTGVLGDDSEVVDRSR